MNCNRTRLTNNKFGFIEKCCGAILHRPFATAWIERPEERLLSFRTLPRGLPVAKYCKAANTPWYINVKTRFAFENL